MSKITEKQDYEKQKSTLHKTFLWLQKSERKNKEYVHKIMCWLFLFQYEKILTKLMKRSGVKL